MRTSVWVLCLALRDGLHGCWVQSATHAVAAAAGRRWDSGPALPWSSGCGEGFWGEALCVGSGIGAGELIWSWRRLLLQRGAKLLWLSGRVHQRISRWFRRDRALEDLCSWHAVTGVWAAALFEQQQFELLVGGAGPLCVPVDGPGDPLQAWWGHGGGGWHRRHWRASSAAGWCVPWCSAEAVPHTQLSGVLPTEHFPFGSENEDMHLKNLYKCQNKHTESAIENPHLCIMANRSSVVRVLVGDRNTLSSSARDSSLSGDTALSLGVESANTNQSTSECAA